MPGHHDAGNEYTSLEDAQNAALYAKEQGLGGKYSLIYNSSPKYKLTNLYLQHLLY
jgi:hypothetical protein